MGNQCSTDRDVIEKEDVFDFRYRGDDGKQDPFAAVQNEDDETDLPSYKDHLNSVAVDPYDDKYAGKGESIFVLNRGIETTNTDLRQPVQNIPEPVVEEPTVFEDPEPEPKPVPAPVQAEPEPVQEEPEPVPEPEPVQEEPVQKQVTNIKKDSHEPEPPVEKVTEMNELSKKCKKVDGLVNPFQRESDPDNDFNETHGPYRYPDESTYKGQYLHGKRQGFGTEVSIYGDKYEGQWDRDAKEGFGRMILFNGDFYEGYTKDGVYDGQGMFIDYETNVVSEGTFKNGLLNGKGTEEYPDGNKYKGEFVDGVKNGEGVFKFKDGSSYSGTFENDMKHGKGKKFRLTFYRNLQEKEWVQIRWNVLQKQETRLWNC